MNQFTVSSKITNGVDILQLSGYLDAHTAAQLESAIEKIVKSGRHNILAEFSGLDYISSAGLGVFMVFIEDVRASGGDIKLCCMKPKVFTVFDLLGFPLLFEIYQTEAEALEKFELADKKQDE